MRGVFALLVSRLYLGVLYANLPLLPVFAALVFGRPDFVLSYRKTLRKCWVHVQALQDEGNRFACGIYSSGWRKYSNCGSFPLSQHDLDRYACPSYHVVPEQKIQFYPKANLNMNAARQSPAAHALAGAGFVATER